MRSLVTYELKMKLNFLIRIHHWSVSIHVIQFAEEKYNLLNALGQLWFSAVPAAVKVNLPDNKNESVPYEGLIHWEMLIKTLAYEKMNDLKDAPDKSSQKWLC